MTSLRTIAALAAVGTLAAMSTWTVSGTLLARRVEARLDDLRERAPRAEVEAAQATWASEVRRRGATRAARA